MSSLQPAKPESPQDIGYPRVMRLPRDILLGIEEDLLVLNKNPLDGPFTDHEVTELGTGLFHEIEADLALHEVELELKAAVTEQAFELSGHPEQDIHAELLDRERAFFTKVFANTTLMAEKYPGPITLLFDVDWTLLHHTKRYDQVDDRVVRPAFGLAIRELSKRQDIGERLEVGILTINLVDQERHTPTYTAPVRSHINPEFLISSRASLRPGSADYDLLHNGDTAAQIAAAKDVLDPEVIASFAQGNMLSHKFYDGKLIILQRLIEQYPDRNFVVFDDIPYAALLRRDGRLRGVRVHEEILDQARLPFGRSSTTDPEQAEPHLL